MEQAMNSRIFTHTDMINALKKIIDTNNAVIEKLSA
jgi:hypothetical protein